MSAISSPFLTSVAPIETVTFSGPSAAGSSECSTRRRALSATSGKVEVGHVRQEDDELLAPPAPDEVERAGRTGKRRRDHLQDRVARVVAVGVVDFLEAVDVDEEDAEPEAVARQLGHLLLEDDLGVAPVPDSRERVEEDDLGQLLDAADRLHPLGLVREDLDRADDGPRGIADGDDLDPHRDPVPGPVVEEDVGPVRLPVGDRGRDRAAVPAELVPFGVDVPEDRLRAGPADDVTGRPARDGLGAPVPERDLPVPIDEVDAVVEVVEQLLREALGKNHAAFSSRPQNGGLKTFRTCSVVSPSYPCIAFTRCASSLSRSDGS